jgi:hypothetical protein
MLPGIIIIIVIIIIIIVIITIIFTITVVVDDVEGVHKSRVPGYRGDWRFCGGA